MANTERLKALQLVRDAKNAVNEALSSVTSADKANPLQKLENCLEELEELLISSMLDEKIAELQGYQKQLESVNALVKKKIGDLKSVAEKVDAAAKAIGIIIDIVGKVAALAAL